MDRPETFHYDLRIGTVIAIHPDEWEVDVQGERGETIQRVLVQGPRLPEITTKERPQLCVVGYAGHLQGRPVCWLLESRLPGERTPRKDVVYYDEVQNFRETITREGVWELRNSKGPLLQVRMLEQDGVIRSDTPSTHIVQTEADGTIVLECTGDARVKAGGNVTVEAGGNADVQAGGDITLQNGGGAKVELVGNQVKING